MRGGVDPPTLPQDAGWGLRGHCSCRRLGLERVEDTSEGSIGRLLTLRDDFAGLFGERLVRSDQLRGEVLDVREVRRLLVLRTQMGLDGRDGELEGLLRDRVTRGTRATSPTLSELVGSGEVVDDGLEGRLIEGAADDSILDLLRDVVSEILVVDLVKLRGFAGGKHVALIERAWHTEAFASYSNGFCRSHFIVSFVYGATHRTGNGISWPGAIVNGLYRFIFRIIGI